MLDYRALNQTGIDFFDADVSNLSNLDIEKVEVVLGPASALYGPGVGAGIVHYLSKDHLNTLEHQLAFNQEGSRKQVVLT